MATLARISRDDQLAAIADPTRQSMLRELMATPATISQLGARRGKHPAWVRYHIKVLEHAGLVTLVETRKVRNYTEKYYGASAQAFLIERVLRPDTPDGPPALVFASHDLAVSLLASETDEAHRPIVGVTGSLDSLIAVRQGIADIAGCHLLDEPSGEYNLPYVRHLFPDRSVVVTTVAHREQGLITAPGNPLALRSVADIAERGTRMINRNGGSGTRVWFDQQLAALGLDGSAIVGYETEVQTHSEAACAVAAGLADVAIGIRAAADAEELGFVPLFRERYDLVVRKDRLGDPGVDSFLNVLHSRRFRSEAGKLHGYDTDETGDEHGMAG